MFPGCKLKPKILFCPLEDTKWGKEVSCSIHPKCSRSYKALLFESLCEKEEKYYLISANKNFVLYKHLVVLTALYAFPPSSLQPPRNPL